MLKDIFGKTEVVIETDAATPGTPFRVCTFRVAGKRCDGECVRKVRAALQMLTPGCEVLDLPPADGKQATKLGLRFRMSYHGQQVPSDQVKQAVERALK